MLDEKELTEAKGSFERWAEHNQYWTDPLLAFLAGWQIASEPVDHPGTDRDPKDRLTRLCDVAGKAVRKDPEGGKDLKLILMIQDGDNGGIEVAGYRDSTDAIVDLLTHARQLMRAHGLNPNKIFESVTTTSIAPAAFKQRR